ncbi:MAG: hypothetical protein ACKOXO_03165 [Cyanobium sp.]
MNFTNTTVTHNPRMSTPACSPEHSGIQAASPLTHTTNQARMTAIPPLVLTEQHDCMRGLPIKKPAAVAAGARKGCGEQPKESSWDQNLKVVLITPPKLENDLSSRFCS